MKKLLLVLLAALVIAVLPLTALASAPATPNQKLALRTGPNTKYVELYMLPQSTRITAYEYESGNDVTWVLIEFTKDGQLCRGYTGLKRMSVNGYIPWADHLDQDVRIISAGNVKAAPAGNAGYRGHVDEDEWVTLLEYEGDYAYIEFYDGANDAPSRGYVEAWRIADPSVWSYDDGSGHDNFGNYAYQPHTGASATPNQKLALRSGPNTAYVELYMLPQSTRIVAYEYEEGNDVTWVLIEYTKDGKVCRGYTGLKRMSVNGYIPWADHLYIYSSAYYSTTVYAAPTGNAGYRGTLASGAQVTILDFESGYAFIEFYDYDNGAFSRGYVPMDAVY